MVRKGTVNWNLATVCLFFFCFLRNDLETGEACFFARFNSPQNQNPTNPHPSHHPAAALQPKAAAQPQPAGAAQHAHDQHQSAKAAVQPPATRPPLYPPGSHKAGGGDGRGRTSGVHPQGDCAKRVWGFLQHACQRICWSTRWVVPTSWLSTPPSHRSWEHYRVFQSWYKLFSEKISIKSNFTPKTTWYKTWFGNALKL